MTEQEEQERHNKSLFFIDNAVIQEKVAEQNWSAAKALLRINTLGLLKGAEHGWPGASFSCLDIVGVLMLGCGLTETELVLAKGHAAAALYAVMHASGSLPRDMLSRYKDGADGLEAHADVVCDTGSLGQTLSTVAGMAAADPTSRFACVLGDGELQEGQNYEALMTINHHKLTNLRLFVDINGFQSDTETKIVMALPDLVLLFQAFGFHVIEIDGHDAGEISAAWKYESTKPVVVLATTIKGGGTSLMPAETHPVTQQPWQPWHTRIPSWALYCHIVEEQLALAACPESTAAWNKHRNVDGLLPTGLELKLPNTLRPSMTGKGTGKAFGEQIVTAMSYSPFLAIVSADLATSCGFNGAVGKPRFFELGVSEQDAVSFATGLALRGNMLPVFGLCYHSDGRSHQSINDTSCFLGMPNLCVCDPVTSSHAIKLADWAVSTHEISNHVTTTALPSLYFRLRRTPVAVESEQIFDNACARSFESGDNNPLRLVTLRGAYSNIKFVVMGTVAFELALTCKKQWQRDIEIVVVTALGQVDAAVSNLPKGTPPQAARLRDSIRDTKVVVTIEDDAGALRSEVAQAIATLKDAPPCLVSRVVKESGPSFRRLSDCLEHFGFTPRAMLELIRPHIEGLELDL